MRSRFGVAFVFAIVALSASLALSAYGLSRGTQRDEELAARIESARRREVIARAEVRHVQKELGETNRLLATIAAQLGLTLNQLREMAGLPPVEGGDVFPGPAPPPGTTTILPAEPAAPPTTGGAAPSPGPTSPPGTTTTSTSTTTTTLPPAPAVPDPDFYVVFGSPSQRLPTSRTDFSLSGGTASQVRNPDGTISLSYTGCTSYCDNGFWIVGGTLATLGTITITTDATLGVNLWLDSNGDGDFFQWAADGTFIGTDGDDYGFTPGTAAGTLTIDQGTSIAMQTHGGGTFTVAQLAAGAFQGVTGATTWAVWVGICCGGPATPDNSATVTSLTGL